jgi:dimeric dUTPase (all-alpha-NTP-PPase superfamily)
MKSYESFTVFAKSNKNEDFQKALIEFLKLGVMLKFTYDDIKKAYDLKAEENRKRQQTNY